MNEGNADPKVLAKVAKMDAKYFEQHPDKDRYYRKFVIGENYFTPSDMPAPKNTYVTCVKQICHGVRTREFLQLPKTSVKEFLRLAKIAPPVLISESEESNSIGKKKREDPTLVP